jgi:hypothetical protein
MTAAEHRGPGSRIVALAVRRLPTEHRERYRAEFDAELHDLTGAHRLTYALRVVLCVRALRAALGPGRVGEPAGTQPATWVVPHWPHSRIWCRARLHHRWAVVSVEDSTYRYRQCQACGQEYFFDSRIRAWPPMTR